jgi:hypothetical protein
MDDRGFEHVNIFFKVKCSAQTLQANINNDDLIENGEFRRVKPTPSNNGFRSNSKLMCISF